MADLVVRPATLARFDDVATMVGPKNPAASVCWCLSHRVDARTNRSMAGPERGEFVRSLCARDVAPGVLAAAEQGAPAVEGYPVDNRGEKVDLTMAFVGLRSVFERAGFTKVADTDAVSGGFPRVVMRRGL